MGTHARAHEVLSCALRTEGLVRDFGRGVGLGSFGESEMIRSKIVTKEAERPAPYTVTRIDYDVKVESTEGAATTEEEFECFALALAQQPVKGTPGLDPQTGIVSATFIVSSSDRETARRAAIDSFTAAFSDAHLRGSVARTQFDLGSS